MAVSDERSLLPAGFPLTLQLFSEPPQSTLLPHDPAVGVAASILAVVPPPPGTAPSQCPHVDASVLQTSVSPATGEGRTGTLSRRP